MVEADPYAAGTEAGDDMRESQAISDPNIYNAGQQNNDVFSDDKTFDYSVRDP